MLFQTSPPYYTLQFLWISNPNFSDLIIFKMISILWQWVVTIRVFLVSLSQASVPTFKTKPFNVRRTYSCIFIRSMRKSKYLNVLKMRPIITQNNMHVTYYQQNAPWNFLCPQNLRGWQVYHATCSAQGLPTGLVYASAVTQMPLDSCVAENVSDITSRLLVLETERDKSANFTCIWMLFCSYDITKSNPPKLNHKNKFMFTHWTQTSALSDKMDSTEWNLYF